MGKVAVITLMLFLGSCLASYGQSQLQKEMKSQSMLKIAEAVICTDVSERTPSGIARSFPPDIKKLYCFTKIVGATKETFVKHLWYFDRQMMAEVMLPVKSVRWRTYSSKRILPQWQGLWKVEIQDENGQVLTTLDFEIR
ncbi:MAG TPA: DUF2914 domain-containing protein [Syntrophaceae bacterium]|nr:DUF2914 domain-containing protein [Syntrophaceae bacterium]